MYENFEKIMLKRGLNINKVAKGVGISPSTLTDWRAGRYTPKTDKRQKIADFLGVSLHYLDTGEEAETIELNSSDYNLLQMLKDDPKLQVLLHTPPRRAVYIHTGICRLYYAPEKWQENISRDIWHAFGTLIGQIGTNLDTLSHNIFQF